MSAIRFFISRDASSRSVGSEDIAHAIVQEATLRAINVEIIRTGARGMMWLEPLVEVETAQGRIAYGPVTPGDIGGLFDAGFTEGEPHALCLGLTQNIPYLKSQQRITFSRTGVIDPLNLAHYRAYGGFAGLEAAGKLKPVEIIEEVVTSGLRGRGGAGFPAGIKWRTVAAVNSERKYIVCNADEGDSGTFADRMVMEGDPFMLIEGMLIAGLATGATHSFVYIRSEYPDAVTTMRAAIEIARRAGYIGKAFDIEVRVGAGAYICGEETALLESLEGKRGQVRSKPPLPAHQGLFGKPTVINNVLTLAAIPWILQHGGKAYAAFGTGRSRGTMPFQLAGNVKYPGLYETAFGMSLREVIFDIGGGTASGRPVYAVQVGGPLGAYFPENLLDTKLDYEAMITAGGMLGHGGIVVFDNRADMAKQARFAMDFCAIESCGKCTPCRIGSTRGVETLDKIVAGIDRERNIALIKDLCAVMTDGSLCALGGLTPMPVMSALTHFPEAFKQSPVKSAAQ